MEPELFAPDPTEPLGLWWREDPPPHAGLRALAFEFSSRGDRVPGRVWLPPDAGGPWPVVLLEHGAGGAEDAPTLDAVAAPWARGGVAVASVDLPLHGQRASSKLGGMLRAGLGPDPGGPVAAGIAREFLRQAVIDLRRCVDALAGLDALDADRIAYAGLGLGAVVGATFCSQDARPRAAVLALAGADGGDSELDPGRCVGRIAPRPILFVNATRDARVPRERAERLHAAAGEGASVLWVDSGHADLPGRALEAMGRFLRASLLPEG